MVNSTLLIDDAHAARALTESRPRRWLYNTRAQTHRHTRVSQVAGYARDIETILSSFNRQRDRRTDRQTSAAEDE